MITRAQGVEAWGTSGGMRGEKWIDGPYGDVLDPRSVNGAAAAAERLLPEGCCCRGASESRRLRLPICCHEQDDFRSETTYETIEEEGKDEGDEKNQTLETQKFQPKMDTQSMKHPRIETHQQSSSHFVFSSTTHNHHNFTLSLPNLTQLSLVSHHFRFPLYIMEETAYICLFFFFFVFLQILCSYFSSSPPPSPHLYLHQSGNFVCFYFYFFFFYLFSFLFCMGFYNILVILVNLRAKMTF